MSGTFKITISELREIIQEIISESLIEEKFGEKIGDQYAGPGVADECGLNERDDDVQYVNMYGELPCDQCGNMFHPRAETDGRALDTTCKKCAGEINEVTPKGYEKIVKGIKKSGTAKNPWAIANAMKKKGIKPKKK